MLSHRSQGATFDLGDFFVRQTTYFSKKENLPLIRLELAQSEAQSSEEERPFDQTVRQRSFILEVHQTFVVYTARVRKESLEEHEPFNRPIPHLILRQVAGDGVHPCSKIPRLIESFDVSTNPKKRFLNEILCLLSVTDSLIDKGLELVRISPVNLVESPLLSSEKRPHEFNIRMLSKTRHARLQVKSVCTIP